MAQATCAPHYLLAPAGAYKNRPLARAACRVVRGLVAKEAQPNTLRM